MRYNVNLHRCSRNYPTYKVIRDRHYIPNRGCIGAQLHYLIELDNEIVGVISGASPAFDVKTRDQFFGLSSKPDRKGAQLKHILGNNVFRLEVRRPNLGTQVLALWRRTVIKDFRSTYHRELVGLESFIEPSECRHGALYRADNWSQVGITAGTARRQHGIRNNGQHSVSRVQTTRKLIMVRWVGDHQSLPEVSWREQLNLFDAAA